TRPPPRPPLFPYTTLFRSRVSRRPAGPGEYEITAVVPPCLNVGDYVVGVWLGTSYETFLDDPAVATLRLEGSISNRPERLVELPLEWTHKDSGAGVGAASDSQENSWTKWASDSTSPSD